MANDFMHLNFSLNLALINLENIKYDAAGIIFDNTRYKDAVFYGFGGGLPDFENRNLDSQYWVFWPREAASKGIEKGMNLTLVDRWDGAFNLTARKGPIRWSIFSYATPPFVKHGGLGFARFEEVVFQYFFS